VSHILVPCEVSAKDEEIVDHRARNVYSKVGYVWVQAEAEERSSIEYIINTAEWAVREVQTEAEDRVERPVHNEI
jgi:hypothetical protein